MLWRAWSFLAGAPIGVLAATALGAGSGPAFAVAALASASLSLGVGSRIVRRREGEPAVRVQVSVAASAGWAALPPALAACLQLSPGPAFWLGVQLAVSAGAFALARRGRGRGGGGMRPLAIGALWLVGSCGAVLGGAALAAWSAAPPAPVPGLAEAIYDLDALVATRPLPVCRDDGSTLRILEPRGARPRLDPSGEQLWFDAETEDGRRQVFRLDLDAGGVECWTCDEPGNNVRPYAAHSGLVFETDRHATRSDPTNSEIHLIRRGEVPGPSRRLTRSPGPDGHPLLAPGTGRLVWTRRAGGHAVVWAAVQSAHGALRLGPKTLLARGGSAWLAPSAWSPDARALVVSRGNPFAPLELRALDLATGEERLLSDDAVPGGAAFSADGALVVVARSQRAHPVGRLPTALAALFAPWADALERDAVLFRGTTLHVGATSGPLKRLIVPALESWGAPTGVALSADGTRVFLGQRAEAGRERLVEIVRSCR